MFPKIILALIAFQIVLLLPADITNLSNKKISDQLYELSFNTSNLEKPEFAYVIVPANYERDNRLFPAVYLLHGWLGNYKIWYEKNGTDLKRLSNLYNLIIVMPDGGFAGWYIDSPIKKSSNYESTIANDVVQAIDQSFNTFKLSSKRAITGLSMGGYGAFRIGFKYPETFGNIGSMSGGLELIAAGEADPEAERYFNIDSVLSSDSSKWTDYDLNGVLDNAKKSKQSIIFDCGVNDIFIKINRNFHAEMLKMQIPHDYTERPGIHDWAYWDNSIDYQMLFFSKHFSSASLRIK